LTKKQANHAKCPFALETYLQTLNPWNEISKRNSFIVATRRAKCPFKQAAVEYNED